MKIQSEQNEKHHFTLKESTVIFFVCSIKKQLQIIIKVDRNSINQ